MLVYCISGLGADERVFSKLQLEAEIKHIKWVKPLPREGLTDYSKRLREQIDASQPFSLLGVSFGGVVAQEMAQFIAAEKVVVVSSFSEYSLLPVVMRFPLLLPLLRVLPGSWLKPPRRLMARLFGIEQPLERQLFYQILEDTDPYFLRWAVGALLQLRSFPKLPNLVHIHGTSDRLISCPRDKRVLKIDGGEHFMIYTLAAELSKLLNGILKR